MDETVVVRPWNWKALSTPVPRLKALPPSAVAKFTKKGTGTGAPRTKFTGDHCRPQRNSLFTLLPNVEWSAAVINHLVEPWPESIPPRNGASMPLVLTSGKSDVLVLDNTNSSLWEPTGDFSTN